MPCDPFPRGLTLNVHAPARGCDFTALYDGVAWPVRGRAYQEVRTASDPALLHRVELRWARPVALRAVEVTWPAGYRPTAWRPRLIVADPDGGPPLLAPLLSAEPDDVWLAPDRDTQRIDLGPDAPPALGLAVEQRPGSGGPKGPDQLRLARVLPIAAATPDHDAALIDDAGARQPLRLPVLCDGDPDTSAALGHATTLELAYAAPRTARGLRLTLAHVGSVGRPQDLARWLASVAHVELRAEADPGWRPHPVHTRALDARDAGIVAGRAEAWLDWGAPVALTGLRLPLPGVRTSALFAHAAALTDAPPPPTLAALPYAPLPDHPNGRRLLDAPQGDPTLQRALALTPPPTSPRDLSGLVHAPAHAASLGVPGTEPRAGVGPDGHLLLSPWTGPHARSRGACLHLGLAVAPSPKAPPVPLHAWADQLTRQTAHTSPHLLIHARAGALRVAQRLVPDLTASPDTPVLRWEITLHNDGPSPAAVALVIAAALRDGPWPLPLPWRIDPDAPELLLRWDDGSIALHAPDPWRAQLGEPLGGEHRVHLHTLLASGAHACWILTLPLAPRDTLPAHSPPLRLAQRLGDAAQEHLRGVAPFSLPAPWGRLARALLAQSTLFFRADGRATYGLFPSVYDGDVFGLEEDYLLYGVACWGATQAAVAALRATYLTPAHLDPGHYLHDLRNGLTPWQTARLLALDGRRPDDALTPAQLDLLRACGAWTLAQHHATREATGEADETGLRVFPGLLEPFRYGGDLDLPTQSLSASAANCAGLRGLAALTRGAERDRWAAAAARAERALRRAFDALKRPAPPRYPMHTAPGDATRSYDPLMTAGIVAPLGLFHPDDPIARALHDDMRAAGDLALGLPRFDDWGAHRPGIDAHYSVGHLMHALHSGQRDRFWACLCGYVAAAFDPEVLTAREVGPLHLDPPPWGHDTGLSGTALGRSAPCVGSPGVLLQLLRHALITEQPAPDGAPSRTLLLLHGTPDAWWDTRALVFLGPVPTHAGPCTLRAERRGAVLTVAIDAPQAARVVLRAPRLDGAPPALVRGGPDGLDPARPDLPGGAWTLELIYA